MKNPLGVSTLEEAASWLSEYSGRQWSAREVLDLGFKRSLADFQRDGVEASLTLWAALPPSTRFVFRRWTVEKGCERRPTDWQLVQITYENVFALLCGGGSAAVEFPRASDPWDGEDRLCIDSPDTHVLVSIDMLRVYARDLVCLAAESTASAETEQSVSTDQPRSADAEPVPEEVKHSDAEMAATPAVEQPTCAEAQPIPSGELIPGKLPRVAAGRLAVKAAWEIELETKRAATVPEVMKRLQSWADEGKEPEYLIRSDRKCVVWNAGSKEKPYDEEACGKTIERWKISRR